MCMQVKKQQLETNMGQWTGSKLGKESVKAVLCHPTYLTYLQNQNRLTDMENKLMVTKGEKEEK